VRKGDVIAAFDPQAVKDHLDDTRDALHDRSNMLARKKTLLDLEVENLTQQLRKAKAKMDKARLDLGTIPVRSGIKAETLRIAAALAEDEFNALEAELPLRIQSQAASLRISELNEEMEQLHVERHEQDLAHLTIHAPNDGTVVVQTMRRSMGEQVTLGVGDRVTPGALLMRVVDSSRMQVEGLINQAECGNFRIGQEAIVRVDAYPEAVFRGRVYAIGAMASNPGRQQYFLRTIPIRVEILDGDSRLLPDLSASADVLVEKAANVLLAPAQALHEENGQTVVYLQKPDGVERRPVVKARVHGSQAALLEGVEAGDVVVIDER
jgi:HlyD family secretion protein